MRTNYTSNERADGTILIVEDDPEDVYILERSLKRTRMNLATVVADDGQDALDYLNNLASDQRLSEIDLIILDLNMPRMNGHEFLKICRAHSQFKQIPIVVLTTSQEEEIRQQALDDGANAVIAKADTLDGMMVIADAIIQNWFEAAKAKLIAS